MYYLASINITGYIIPGMLYLYLHDWKIPSSQVAWYKNSRNHKNI